MEHLHDTHAKKGDEFLNRLLNDAVVINIKIDQAAFVIKKHAGKVTYHGREGRGEINKVKRAMMDTYEDAIKHIEDQSVSNLPDGIEIYLELFSDKWKTKVQYETKPKNNLMISYIKKNGETLLPNDPDNKSVAKTLDVSPPPVLFSGKLSETQKLAIKQFIESPVEERKQKYGESKFLDFVMSMFVTPEEFKWLHQGGYEGVVFYFRDSQYTAKMVDPMFTAEKQEESGEQMGDFRRILIDFVHTNLKNDLDVAAEQFVRSPNIVNTEDVYIEFISTLTLLMVNKHSDELKELDKYEHEQKSQRFSNLTFSLLPPFMKQLVKQHWWVEELFAVLANTLQKEKVRINIKQGLTKERKEAINDMVARLRGKGLVK